MLEAADSATVCKQSAAGLCCPSRTVGKIIMHGEVFTNPRGSEASKNVNIMVRQKTQMLLLKCVKGMIISHFYNTRRDFCVPECMWSSFTRQTHLHALAVVEEHVAQLFGDHVQVSLLPLVGPGQNVELGEVRRESVERSEANQKTSQVKPLNRQLLSENVTSQ